MENVLQEIKAFFSELEFNAEAHSYNHRGRALSSVSSYIKRYTEPFDAHKIAGFVAKKRGCSREEVLQEWEDKKNAACDKGNKAHYFGETYVLDKTKPSTPYEQAIVNFWDSIPEHIIPMSFELQMYSVELGIAGTSDIILYNTITKKFIIADYKTNEDLFKNYKGKKLLAPFQDQLDSPFGKYQIQLSFYQLLFEQLGEGFEVEARYIIWLRPDGTFERFSTSDLREQILTTFIN